MGGRGSSAGGGGGGGSQGNVDGADGKKRDPKELEKIKQEIERAKKSQSTVKIKPVELGEKENWKLNKMEDHIRDKKIEYAVFFDPQTMKPIAMYQGEKGHVSTPAAMNNITDVVFTHNHPKTSGNGYGGVFSTADIQSFAGSKVSEIRAVSNGPSEFNYIIKAKNNTNRKGLLKNLAKNGLQIEAEGIYDSRELQKQLEADWKKKNPNKLMPKEVYDRIKTRARQKQMQSAVNYIKELANKYHFDYIPLKKRYTYDR